ncbi:aldehyde ferredoxin oxidoreductase family protein [Desulfovibrio inopinatus]|uniref:aldehyde ferredoxin oxidoreductase family protein n=1 Tax=Desulfovibrio inopinatus TaxID=102109 RepID=UPI000415DB5B|nr:aldehyde ferredoxin oxidoreductase family protein [Desulfovibrio inopinatus]
MSNVICSIDLSTRMIESTPVDADLSRRYLGGRGIHIRLLYDLVSPGMDPLAPEAPLLVGAGPLAGLPCPSAARTNVTGKSPESWFLADSNFGGHFAPAMRKAGFDHLVLTGKSDEPCLILLENNTASIQDASGLWGKDSIATMELLKERYGKRAQIACIGPAGENLVRFACIRHGYKSAAGKGGLGCLMGSKRIKAIVALGHTPLPIHNPEGLRALNKKLTDRIKASRTREILHTLGTAYLFDLHNFSGVVRTHNARFSKFPQGKGLRSRSLAKRYDGHRACFGCAIGCRHTYLRPDTSCHSRGVGVEYGTLGAFGPICGITDPETILHLNDLTNDLGLDSCATGNLIGWAIDLFQEGLLTTTDTDGLELSFGDGPTIVRLVEDIAYRRGFGSTLADGPKELMEHFPKEATDRLVQVKNSTQTDSVDVRAFKGFALGVATSTRGADHLRSRPTMEAINLDAATLEKFYGRSIPTDPDAYDGKAFMVWRSELEYALGDALGLCRFVQRFNSPDHISPDEIRQLLNLACGIDLTAEELENAAERILTTERLFLNREGITRRDDTLPPWVFTPIQDGPRKGAYIDRERFEAMLDEYYSLHGWDPQTGRPTQETLRRLGI